MRYAHRIVERRGMLTSGQDIPVGDDANVGLRQRVGEKLRNT